MRNKSTYCKATEGAVSPLQHYSTRTEDKKGRSKDALVPDCCRGGEFLPFKRTVFNKGRSEENGVVHSLTTPELLTTMFGGKNSINKRIFPGNF